MKLLRHPVAAMVLMAVLISLLIPMYKALETGYGITDTGIKTAVNATGGEFTGNIIDHFDHLRLKEGLSDISSSITKIATGSNVIDLLGGLAGAALGILKSVLGLITIPYEIISILLLFYGTTMPIAQLGGIVMMIVVYVGFILLSAYLRKDV